MLAPFTDYSETKCLPTKERQEKDSSAAFGNLVASNDAQEKVSPLDFLANYTPLGSNLEFGSAACSQTENEFRNGVEFSSALQSFRCSTDLKILCRLIASHHRKPDEKSCVSFFVDGINLRFEVKLSIDIGQNVKCLVFRRESSQMTYLENDNLIFAFNWFSPERFWDYLSLGYRLLTGPCMMDEEFKMCNNVAMEHARQFYDNPRVCKLLDAIYKENSFKDQRIIITGFSMGGSTAHAFTVLLKERRKLIQPIRCVGFGCPKPGNAMLTEWFKENLTEDSLNIVLASEIKDQKRDTNSSSLCNGAGTCNESNERTSNESCIQYDPVCITPDCSKGFDIHPNLYYILKEKPGILYRISKIERERLKHSQVPKSRLLSLITEFIPGSPFHSNIAADMDQLHSILKYYEAMMAAE